MEAKLPNFLIVGAAKSGTSFLYHSLRRHPQIYMPGDKEPKFFVSSIKKKGFHKTVVFAFKEYADLFRGVRKEKAIGEASVQYLYHYTTAIPHIKKYLGDIKIIIILRNPVDRAYSAYIHLYRIGQETLSFEESLKTEEARKRDDKFVFSLYKSAGLYYNQVKAYLENFSQVKVYLYDDLVKDSLGLVKDIYKFLEVDASFIPPLSIKYNIGGIPKSRLLQDFLLKPNILRRIFKPIVSIFLSKEKRDILRARLRNLNLRKYPEMRPETREYLKGIFRQDILKLQDLIKRDLSGWLR